MSIILYVGMDAHSTNYILCTFSFQVNSETGTIEERTGYQVQIEPDYKLILAYESSCRS